MTSRDDPEKFRNELLYIKKYGEVRYFLSRLRLVIEDIEFQNLGMVFSVLIDCGDLLELKELGVEKIESWAKSRDLSKVRGFYFIEILVLWQVLGSSERVKGYIEDYIQTDAGLFDFIGKFVENG